MPWKVYPHIKRRKKRIIDEIRTIAMIDNIFAQVVHSFLAQEVSPILLPSSMNPTMVLFTGNAIHEGPNYQQSQ
jgi:hypothetical protein